MGGDAGSARSARLISAYIDRLNELIATAENMQAGGMDGSSYSYWSGMLYAFNTAIAELETLILSEAAEANRDQQGANNFSI